MKCLLVPLELAEFPYHRKKSYLAYKVTCCGGKSHFVGTSQFNIFTAFGYLREQCHTFIKHLLNVSRWECHLSVWRSADVTANHIVTLQCFKWKWSRSHSWYMKGWEVLLVGLFPCFFSFLTFTVGWYFSLKLTQCQMSLGMSFMTFKGVFKYCRNISP